MEQSPTNEIEAQPSVQKPPSQSNIKSVLREFGLATVAGIVGGIIVFAVGDAYANRKTEMRIFQNHAQNYVVACEILHVLPSDGLNVELYDTSVYKSSLEYLSFKPTEQQKKMHIAMTLMDTANALTTLSMDKTVRQIGAARPAGGVPNEYSAAFVRVG